MKAGADQRGGGIVDAEIDGAPDSGFLPIGIDRFFFLPPGKRGAQPGVVTAKQEEQIVPGAKLARRRGAFLAAHIEKIPHAVEVAERRDGTRHFLAIAAITANRCVAAAAAIDHAKSPIGAEHRAADRLPTVIAHAKA